MIRTAAIVAGIALAGVANPAAAQRTWRNDGPPAGYPSAMLWPVNDSTDIHQITLSAEYSAALDAYIEFATDHKVMGMPELYHRIERYRPELAGAALNKFIGEMKPGQIETWDGRGYKGSFTLIGTAPVGPFQCRQTQWTMAGTKGKATVPRLDCFNPKTGKWQYVWKHVPVTRKTGVPHR
ncbi:MAG: hypothetical protein MT490_16150 [Sphingomonas sp.]|uniref:hypothetical protein n=1 Tax=Sphingomonas sp. TaxID=28214 RepID=UPI0022767D40|nr:hypothetical protein [Sphingomonas sp.]MCX8477320.1 hypothetical protein [Sphingomonas sp.]